MATFKFFPQLNQEDDTSWMCSRRPMTEAIAHHYFSSDSLQDKLVHSLAKEKVLPIKEVLECFEFVARIRKTVRSACVADLCCGHGLVGVLMGIFEKRVERVLLVDKVQPPSYSKLIQAVSDVAPWVTSKIDYQIGSLNQVSMPKNTSVVSAHACGLLTDKCLEIAITAGAQVAVMPCCYPKRSCKAPAAILNAFGEGLAFDIDRTYSLENNGYTVKWSEIPRPITPMNRVIIGRT